jgi:tetratricopeptide (TPR) repeat protein
LPEVEELVALVDDPQYDVDAPPIVLDDPLGDIPDAPPSAHERGMGIVKSTPSSSPLLRLDSSRSDDFATSPTPASPLMGLESTSLADEPIDTDMGTPALAGLEQTSLAGGVPEIDDQAIAESMDEAQPIHEGTVEEPVLEEGLVADSVIESPVVDEPAAEPLTAESIADSFDAALDFVLPDSLSAPPEAASSSIDLDLSDLVTPSSPAPPRQARPTPNTSRVALEGLPLMDLEVPRATPSASRSSQQSMMPVSGELDILDGTLPEQEPESFPPPERETPIRTTSPTPSMGIYLDDTLTIDGERIAMPTPSATRRATIVAAQAVSVLKASVEREPENWGLHRELAEVMLEAGDRPGGIAELELAMAGAERSHDLELASSLAEEIARLEPDSVKHHQKRVEFAFLTNDRSRLIEAYVSLADTLLRADQPDKARVVYQRVLDLAPDDIRARSALDTIVVIGPDAGSSSRGAAPAPRRPALETPSAATRMPAESTPGGSFVNLGDWLRDAEAPKDTRMVVEEQEPTGDEDADFADMLRKFKQGVAENVDPEDYQSHYDLAIAYKEMGLLDEAIAEFQKALGSPTNRLPTYEALGQCFMEKSQFKLASSILSRALNETTSEEKLVGVLYLLGCSAEAQGQPAEAVNYFQRVFVLDIQFRDVADRLSSLERALR